MLRELPRPKGRSFQLQRREQYRGLSTSGLTDSASIGSLDRTGRDHTLCFIANILRRIDIPVMQDTAVVASP